MIVGMGDTVLAGPVEFSPAEIAAIVAVLIGLFVVVTAPGWAVLGIAAARRRRTRRDVRVWPAAVGGCLGGIVVSGMVCAAVGGLWDGGGSSVAVVAVLLSWATCWALAAMVRPGPAPRDDTPAHVPEGWGR